MNKRRRNYLRDLRSLENCLPGILPGNTGPLLDFLDSEAASEGKFNRETFFLLLDQASEKPLSRLARGDMSELLAGLETSGDKIRLIDLLRNVLENIAKRGKAPYYGTPQIEIISYFGGAPTWPGQF